MFTYGQWMFIWHSSKVVVDAVDAVFVVVVVVVVLLAIIVIMTWNITLLVAQWDSDPKNAKPWNTLAYKHWRQDKNKDDKLG